MTPIIKSIKIDTFNTWSWSTENEEGSVVNCGTLYIVAHK